MEASNNIHTVPMRDRTVLGHIDGTLKEYWQSQLTAAQKAVEVATGELRVIEDHEMALAGLANEAERLRVAQNGAPTGLNR